MKHVNTLAAILLMALLSACSSGYESQEQVITVQTGFHPTQRKDVVVIYKDKLLSANFDIVDNTGKVMYTGKLTDVGFYEESGDFLAKGNFTDFTTPGKYTILVKPYGESFPFIISDSVHKPTLRLALRWLYLQRSGIDKNDKEADVVLKADYLKPAYLWDDKGIDKTKTYDVKGGWWDAGDFGRYTSPAATTIMSLFYAWQFNPSLFADGLTNIPESGNGISDLLDEARWELEWMLKVQRTDGAVHHKVTSKNFVYGLAQDSKETLYLFDVSTQATAHFAAVMAEAYLVYLDIDPAFANKMLSSARKAWQWLETQPVNYPKGGFQNPVDVDGVQAKGGPYHIGDEKMDELRIWAAASLFKATGEPAYDDAFQQLFGKISKTASYGMSEYDGFAFALFSYLDIPTANAQVRKDIFKLIKAACEEKIAVTNASPFSVALQHKKDGYQYNWGSNGYTLQHGQFLLLAYKHIQDKRYVDYAAGQLNYILGCNALNLCQMNGNIGTKHLQTSHTAYSIKTGKVFPGTVGEGVNAEGGDKALQRLVDNGTPPARCLLDDIKSYASNEPTIYANAAFVAVAAWFCK